MDGDTSNLPVIKSYLRGRSIDFLHYDSDKTYLGRKAFFDEILEYMAPDGWVMVDDIRDNDHFMHLVNAVKPERCYTFIHKESVVAGAFQMPGNL